MRRSPAMRRQRAHRASRAGGPVLVLPLHGHLAPAAWAAAQAAPGIAGRLRADRGRGAAGLALPRRRRAARARPALRPHHRGPAYGGEHEALSTVGALDAAATGLGWDAILVGPGPGIIGSDTALRPRRHGRPRQRPRRALARLPTLLSPASPPPTPASATAASATTPRPSSSCCSRRSRWRSPRARPEIADALAAEPRDGRHRLREAPADLDGYAASGLPTTTMGRTLDRGPAVLRRPARRRRRPGTAAALAAGKGSTAGGDEDPRHGDRRQAGRLPPPQPADARRRRPLRVAWSSTSSPTWSWSAASRATPSTPTAPTSSSTASTSPPTISTRCGRGPADVADFLAELATGEGERPACSAATIHRKAACLRSFYKHLRRDELIGDDPTAALSAPRRVEEAAAGPQLRRGAEAAGGAARRRADGAARPGAAGGDVRVRAAGLGDDRAGAWPTSTCARASCGRAARARRNGWCRSGARRSRRSRLPARRPPEAGRRAPRGEAVRQLPRRAADPPGPLQDRPAPRPRRPASPADEPAHAAPQLRHPPARRRLRPARRAGDARPRRHRHHPDVHAPLRRAA